MIELTFQEFHDQQYENNHFRLYVMKNGRADVMYVGISTNNIWERWFGWGGHMLWDGNVIYGQSPIGVKIENHLPDSLKWKIQLWNLQDCLVFCRKELPTDASTITIREIEPIMIRKLSPALNGTYNLNPGKDSTPKSKREIERQRVLDQLYKDVFDKK
jgi:hypothetical protein